MNLTIGLFLVLLSAGFAIFTKNKLIRMVASAMLAIVLIAVSISIFTAIPSADNPVTGDEFSSSWSLLSKQGLLVIVGGMIIALLILSGTIEIIKDPDTAVARKFTGTVGLLLVIVTISALIFGPEKTMDRLDKSRQSWGETLGFYETEVESEVAAKEEEKGWFSSLFDDEQIVYGSTPVGHRGGHPVYTLTSYDQMFEFKPNEIIRVSVPPYHCFGLDPELYVGPDATLMAAAGEVKWMRILRLRNDTPSKRVVMRAVAPGDAAFGIRCETVPEQIARIGIL